MGTWTQLGTGSRSRQAVQALSEAAPTLEADGVDLTGVVSVALVVHAPSGQTFDGTGSLLGYVWNGSMWVPADYFTRDLSFVSGVEHGSLPPLPIISGRGKLLLRPNGVGVSGVGTEMTTEYWTVVRSQHVIGVPS